MAGILFGVSLELSLLKIPNPRYPTLSIHVPGFWLLSDLEPRKFEFNGRVSNTPCLAEASPYATLSMPLVGEKGKSVGVPVL